MEPSAGVEFVRRHHRAVLATERDDGRVALSPVVAGTDGGTVVISTRETAYKVRHLRRRPRATLLVLPDEFFGPWVQLEGPVEVVSLPEAMEGLVGYYRQLSGEHPDWDDYRRAMISERRALLRLTVERAGPDRAG